MQSTDSKRLQSWHLKKSFFATSLSLSLSLSLKPSIEPIQQQLPVAAAANAPPSISIFYIL